MKKKKQIKTCVQTSAKQQSMRAIANFNIEIMNAAKHRNINRVTSYAMMFKKPIKFQNDIDVEAVAVQK
jgi:hypothetical protein